MPGPSACGVASGTRTHGWRCATTTGAGSFDAPSYDVKLRVDDLFAGDEGIGQLSSRLTLRDELLTIVDLEIASPRLAVSGAGRGAQTADKDGVISLRVTDTTQDTKGPVF